MRIAAVQAGEHLDGRGPRFSWGEMPSLPSPADFVDPKLHSVESGRAVELALDQLAAHGVAEDFPVSAANDKKLLTARLDSPWRWGQRSPNR